MVAIGVKADIVAERLPADQKEAARTVTALRGHACVIERAVSPLISRAMR